MRPSGRTLYSLLLCCRCLEYWIILPPLRNHCRLCRLHWPLPKLPATAQPPTTRQARRLPCLFPRCTNCKRRDCRVKVEHRIHWPQTQRSRYRIRFCFCSPRAAMPALPLAKKLPCPWHGPVAKTMLRPTTTANIGAGRWLLSALAPLQTTAARAGNWPSCLMTSWRSHGRTTWPPPLSTDGQMSQREPLILRSNI